MELIASQSIAILTFICVERSSTNFVTVERTSGPVVAGSAGWPRTPRRAAARRNRGKLGTRSGLYYEPDHPISDGTKVVKEGKVMYSLLASYMYMLYTALLATASKIRPSSLGIYTIHVEMPQRPKGTQTSSYTVNSVTYWVSA